VRSTADLNDTGTGRDRLKRLEQIAHPPRRFLHRNNDVAFPPTNMFRLALLVSELTLERPACKFPARRFSPTHFWFVPFVAKKTEPEN
jgi:hypothetical protein